MIGPLIFYINLVIFYIRGTLRLPREAAAAPPTGPLQRAGEACRQRERPAAALLRPHTNADHRRGQHLSYNYIFSCPYFFISVFKSWYRWFSPLGVQEANCEAVSSLVTAVPPVRQFTVLICHTCTNSRATYYNFTFTSKCSEQSTYNDYILENKINSFLMIGEYTVLLNKLLRYEPLRRRLIQVTNQVF